MQPSKPNPVSPTVRPVVPWNKGAFVGPKPPLKPKQVWSIRLTLQRDGCIRDLALFDLAIDSKLRGCAHVKAGRLTEWLETVLHLYSSRVLPVDVSTARRMNALADYALGQGHAPGLADVTIAATALSRGLMVLTQNLRYFTPLSVSAVNPFEMLPNNITL